MLSPYDDVTMGLTICEGAETGIALSMADLAPVWALGGAGNLASFPVLGGTEALTIAADADPPGQQATAAVAARWRTRGRHHSAANRRLGGPAKGGMSDRDSCDPRAAADAARDRQRLGKRRYSRANGAEPSGQRRHFQLVRFGKIKLDNRRRYIVKNLILATA